MNKATKLFNIIREKINGCSGLTDVQKTTVKVAVIEGLADYLQGEKEENETAMRSLMQLLDNSLPSLELSNEKKNNN